MKVIALVFSLTLSHSAFADHPSRPSLPYANIKIPPSTKSWREFLQATPQRQNELWSFHKGEGRSLKDWNWAWRLGWIRVCSKNSPSKLEFCEDVFREGLQDKALLVRAETASAVQKVYTGSGNVKHLDGLKATFSMPSNWRNGSPLFVQKRVLSALHSIGGDKANTLGNELSKSHPEFERFWHSLKKAEE